MERAGLEPATSGLQSRDRVFALSSGSFEKPLVMRVCEASRRGAPRSQAVRFRDV
jgi:hypothetical protein